MRILIVEDDQKLARQLKKGLAEQGYTARLAFEGQRAPSHGADRKQNETSHCLP